VCQHIYLWIPCVVDDRSFSTFKSFFNPLWMSARLFLQSSELELSRLSPEGECDPLVSGWGGGGKYSRAGEGVAGVPIRMRGHR
jgi:hypothetical protein